MRLMSCTSTAAFASDAPAMASSPLALVTETSAASALTVSVTGVLGTASDFFACCQSKVRVSSTSCRRTSQTPGTARQLRMFSFRSYGLTQTAHIAASGRVIAIGTRLLVVALMRSVEGSVGDR